jgi:hypothetical protein
VPYAISKVLVISGNTIGAVVIKSVVDDFLQLLSNEQQIINAESCKIFIFNAAV